MVMIYLIIFGGTMGSVVKDIWSIDVEDDTISTWDKMVVDQRFWIVVITVAILPICLKKEMQELHIVSMGLFYSVLIFIFILFLQLCFLGANYFAEGEPITFQQFLKPAEDADFVSIMSALSVLLVAFGFATNLFPLYSALKVKTNENCQVAVRWSVVIIAMIYLFLSLTAVFLFGKQIEYADANIMENINKELSVDPDRWESYVMRVMFLVVLACHIPFIFFFGKEGLLIMIDEIDRKSISANLNKRLQQLELRD
mmetsp:Transcript_11012/g.16705  ORF Transcript_11012/g.16705 Transcript_11012/m.16705 type:complete len:256 (+) Transcript_11012:358-1125(+)